MSFLLRHLAASRRESLGLHDPPVRWPRCVSSDEEITRTAGSTSPGAVVRYDACREPFDHVKEI